MNKIKLFAACAGVIGLMTFSGIASAENGAFDDSAQNGCTGCPQAGFCITKEGAISYAKDFAASLQTKQYGKAFSMLDAGTAESIINSYNIYIPGVKADPEELRRDFAAGGKYAELYWKWYIKDNSIDKVNISSIKDAEALEYTEGFNVKNPVCEFGGWTVVSSGSGYAVVIAQG